MKTKNVINFSLIILFVFTIVFAGCKKDTDDIVPSSTTTQTPLTFKVDVPSSLNSSAKSIDNVDTLSGNIIYSNIRTFINVGCAAADVVQGIMTAIHSLNITASMSFTWTSNFDGRPKSFVVVQNAAYEGTTYQFKLTIADGNAPGIQVFWNNSPVKGVAIISPYDWDRTHTSAQFTDTRYRVYYSEAGENSYEKQMVVSIANSPLTYGSNSINNLKMFVGKVGNILTIWGNSNHPNATIIDAAQVGKCYAFVAHSDAGLNIGVAKVAISPTTIASLTDIFTTYAVKKILNDEIVSYYTLHPPMPTQTTINAYLANTDAPAYFAASQGYVSCGATVPSASYNAIADLTSLIPYVPSDVKNLTISFQ